MFKFSFEKFDWILVLLSGVCISLGLLMIYSTTIKATTPSTGLGAFPQQLFYCAIGLCIMLVVGFLDYRQAKGLSVFLYIGSLIAIIYLFVLGEMHGGVNRWIRIGPMNIQPSEVMKIALIIFLAEYFDRHHHTVKHIQVILTSFLVVAIPAYMVFKQPDLGSALVLLAIWLVMAPVAGVPIKYFIGVIGAFIVSTPVLWFFYLEEFQKKRVLSFLYPELYPKDAYQVIQAKIAIGSGGFFGSGIGLGSQTQLQFLPVRHTDFIFSSIAEELGFIGVVVLLIILASLLIRTLYIARRSQDNFGTLLASGIFAMLGFQYLENIGMNIGLSPVTGIPLPFISYGGTSLLISLLCVGILLSISSRQLSPADEEELRVQQL